MLVCIFLLFFFFFLFIIIAIIYYYYYYSYYSNAAASFVTHHAISVHMIGSAHRVRVRIRTMGLGSIPFAHIYTYSFANPFPHIQTADDRTAANTPIPVGSREDAKIARDFFFFTFRCLRIAVFFFLLLYFNFVSLLLVFVSSSSSSQHRYPQTG